MSSYFQLALVGLFNNRTQFVARDVHVSFEGGCAKVGPVINHFASIVRSGELMHDWCKRTTSLEIRCSDMHFWTNDLARINQSFELEIRVGSNAAGGADRSYAQRKIKSGEAAAHV